VSAPGCNAALPRFPLRRRKAIDAKSRGFDASPPPRIGF